MIGALIHLETHIYSGEVSSQKGMFARADLHFIPEASNDEARYLAALGDLDDEKTDIIIGAPKMTTQQPIREKATGSADDIPNSAA